MDPDEERHRREQKELKAQRHASRKSKTDSRLEKERKQKDHIQRILKSKNKGHHGSSSSGGGRPSSKAKSPSSSATTEGGSSTFQALFQKRAEGFMVELNFRNAPPRPPVGPCFVGLRLEGELDRWTRYRPFNAVEAGYSWKLHSEPDLGVPLAASAMDLRCYRDPSTTGAKRRKLGSGYSNSVQNILDEDDDHDNDNNPLRSNNSKTPPPLHPDDAALLHWKGSLTDTAAERLQITRDRARAEARAQALGTVLAKKPANKNDDHNANGAAAPNSTSNIKLKTALRSGVLNQSRVLKDTDLPSWVMRTTYISNDASRKEHDHTSAVTIKRRMAEEVDRKMEETKAKMSDPETIEAQFHAHNKRRVHPTKRHLTVAYDLPLLPDVDTWGHTYTHVVMDNPPRLGRSDNHQYTGEQMAKAFVTDVERQTNGSRMVCTVRVPRTQNDDDDADHDNTRFEAAQRYDLDVVPLKDEDSPHIHFLLIVDDEHKKAVTYHPVSSRVQLSSGRPCTGRRLESVIEKRTLSEEHLRDIEMRVAQVDQDLEDKFNVSGGVGEEDYGDDGSDDDDDDDDDGSDGAF